MSKKAKRSKIKIKTHCKYCGKPTENQYYGEYCCPRCKNDLEIENTYEILASIGVPFMDGEPVGIWSDD